MEKLKMHSVNKAEEQIKKIGELFPHTLTEVIKGYREDGSAIVELAIDFDLLRQELSSVVVEGDEERYQFTWPDKKKSILLANAPIAKTLRPYREESVDFDTTQNLYIEGDNLEALKLLQETYLGKIKMIYIDPPYNTGGDLVYEDNFAVSMQEYMETSGQFDSDGNRLITNMESNGRFHTDWLNMIYPRLKLAKDLLQDDGFIFISIDDNEVENLQKVCNEIFGKENHVNTIAVKMSEATGVKMTHVGKRLPKLKEYLLVYSKGQVKVNPISIPKSNWDDEYKLVAYGVSKEELEFVKEVMHSDESTENDVKKADQICAKMELGNLNRLYSEIGAVTDEQKLQANYDNAWRIMRDVATTGGAKAIADKKRKETDANFFLIITPQKKKYLIKNHYSETASQPRIKMLFADDYLTTNPGDFWGDIKTTGLGNEGEVPFKNGKKPLKLLERIITLATDKDSIILDFFSGSASTAQAVLNKNKEDGGERKFIMVQIDEDLDQSLAKASGDSKNSIKEVIKFLDEIGKPHVISELGKERIRRAGRKIIEEAPELGRHLDVGFRVLKIDSSNMQDVYYTPGEISQDMLLQLEDNIKPDRTSEDLLFQVMLDLGVLLSSKIEESHIGGNKVFSVEDGYLIACFDSNVTAAVITEIAKKQPYYAVFRDSGIASDSVATNFEQMFETYSPTTVRKVL